MLAPSSLVPTTGGRTEPPRDPTPAEPARLRVTYGGPNPAYAARGRRSTETTVVRVARLDRAGSEALPLSIETFLLHRAAIGAAVDSGAVCRVDWSRPHPVYPLDPITKLARVLDALDRRQLAADLDEEGSSPPTA